MKDILVEFTDYGAIVHKNPSTILSKKDLPYCFFNPDLSKVSGVSPSYWVYSKEGTINQASPEERKRRDEYHKGKPLENTVSFKQTLDLMREEISEDIAESIKELSDDISKSIEDLKSFDQQTVNTFSYKIMDIKNDMDSDKKASQSLDDIFAKKLLQQEDQIKKLKLGLAVCVIISILLKVIN
jgi:Asp-tRNA(Asn)/Glu-tRNA(Gln) amidotransferase C subunit